MQALLKENKRTFYLATPIIVGHLSQMLVGLADTMMIGRVGTDELAAVAFVNVLFNFPFVVGIGIFAATSVLVSHAHGENSLVKAADSLRHATLISVVVGLGLALLLLSTTPFLHLFGQSEAVIALAPDYLFWIALSLIPILPAQTIKSFAEAKDHPWPVLWIMLSGVLINIVLNYILIFGHFGAPALGLEGAGIASFCSRLVVLVAVVLYLLKSKRLAPSRPTRWLAPLRLPQSWALARIAAPISGQLTLEFGAFAYGALLIGSFGSAPLAAHQIAITCAALSFMLPLGLAMAVTIRVGHTIGANEYHRCRTLISAAQLTTFVMMSLTALLFVTAGDAIANLFTTDTEVITLAASLFIVVAFFQMVDGFQVIAMGALRGLHDVNWPTLLLFASFWLFGLPIGTIMAIPLKMGALGVWIGIAIGIAAAAFALSWRLKQKLPKV
ncbi:MAG: MATE family efflux transporter [Verrucomicrobiota bacterium]